MAGVLVGAMMMVSAQTCSDTDGGKSYSTKGTASLTTSSLTGTDGCKDTKTLQEYFCITPESSAPPGGPLTWEWHDCSSTETCQSGACKFLETTAGTSIKTSSKTGVSEVTETSSTKARQSGSSSSRAAPRGFREVEGADGNPCFVKDQSASSGRSERKAKGIQSDEGFAAKKIGFNSERRVASSGRVLGGLFSRN